MDAIRQIVTPDASGNLPIQVPIELRQRPVEVIILPTDEVDNGWLTVLTGQNAVDNAWKVIRNRSQVLPCNKVSPYCNRKQPRTD